MNKKLYSDNGYLSFPYIFNMMNKHKTPFCFIVGGRGTGKTYGAFKHCLQNNLEFMYMRRTQTEFESIQKEELSPFKSINRDLNLNINFFLITKYCKSIYDSVYDEDKEKYVQDGDIKGLGCALSTIANIRSFDASNVKVVIYDEFIPEKHVRPIKFEASALFNALETIGRNRELIGADPLKLLALSNANDISNPIFLELGLVTIVDNMLTSGEEIHFIHDKGIMLIVLHDSPVSIAKSMTALYRLTSNTEFSDMSIHNNFTGIMSGLVDSKDLREYRLICIVGELSIYKHKSKMEYYISSHISGTTKNIFTSNINDLRAFKFKFPDLWLKYCTRMVTFENYTLQVLFEKYNRTC